MTQRHAWHRFWHRFEACLRSRRDDDGLDLARRHVQVEDGRPPFRLHGRHVREDRSVPGSEPPVLVDVPEEVQGRRGFACISAGATP